MSDTIEAEVLEIDGSPPPDPRHDPPRARRGDQAWQSMRGRVLRLDRRWWPLWVLVGLVALALLLAAGVVFGALLIVAKLVGGMTRLLTGRGSGGRETGLSRPFS